MFEYIIERKENKKRRENAFSFLLYIFLFGKQKKNGKKMKIHEQK